MDELLKRHQQEERFARSKLAQLSKPRLGQKPLTPEQVAEQSSKLLRDLKQKQEAELAELTERLSRVDVTAVTATPCVSDTPPAAAYCASNSVPAAPTSGSNSASLVSPIAEASSDTPGKKKSRAQQRREKKAAARASGDNDDGEVGPTGPDAREVEIASIMEQLSPKGLEIRHVPADGNCLFRAVSEQLFIVAAPSGSSNLPNKASSSPSVPDHLTLRRRASEHIRAHAADFAPFLPYEPSDGYPEGTSPDPAAVTRAVDRYCSRMASTSCWGGHPELRALSCTLGLPMVVYQAGAPPYSITPDKETVGSGPGGRRADREDEEDDGHLHPSSVVMNDPNLRLQLSFHRSYYTLGEHYNSVVARAQ